MSSAKGFPKVRLSTINPTRSISLLFGEVTGCEPILSGHYVRGVRLTKAVNPGPLRGANPQTMREVYDDLHETIFLGWNDSTSNPIEDMAAYKANLERFFACRCFSSGGEDCKVHPEGPKDFTIEDIKSVITPDTSGATEPVTPASVPPKPKSNS